MNVKDIKTAFYFALKTFKNGRAGLSDIHIEFLLNEIERLKKENEFLKEQNPIKV